MFWLFKHHVFLLTAIIVFLPKGDGGGVLSLSVIFIAFIMLVVFWKHCLPNFYLGLPQGGTLRTLREDLIKLTLRVRKS